MFGMVRKVSGPSTRHAEACPHSVTGCYLVWCSMNYVRDTYLHTRVGFPHVRSPGSSASVLVAVV